MSHIFSRRGFLKRSLLGLTASASTAAGTLVFADAKPAEQTARRLGQAQLPSNAAAVQGVAISGEACFGTNNRGGAGLIHRYDPDWKLIQTRTLKVDGVDHIGALSHSDGSLWAGWLSTKPPKRTVVTEIRAADLTIVRQFEITADVTWIDPVCFDGKQIWVGDLNDLGLHRYEIRDSRLVRNAVFRYPKEMHFSQGLQIRGDRLYSMHTFGSMDGLFEFQIPDLRADAVNLPARFWPIAESTMHLEGFDFVPGRDDEIWHAQGSQVDHWQLVGL